MNRSLLTNRTERPGVGGRMVLVVIVAIEAEIDGVWILGRERED